MPYPYGYSNPYQQGYTGYIPQMPQQQIPPAIPAPQVPAGMIWVQGEAGAKSYLVASGNTVPLWDSENQTIYIKSVDANGMPSMRVLDYQERQSAPQLPKTPAAEFVTRKEFEAAIASLRASNVTEQEGTA